MLQISAWLSLLMLALSTPWGEVVRMILRDVFVVAAIGLAIGIGVALGTARFVASFLYGIGATDPLSLAAAAGLLLAAAILAGYAPARRAARVDPMAALRHE